MSTPVKTQLFLFIKDDETGWSEWLRKADLSAYSAVDIVYNKLDMDFLKRFRFTLSHKDWFIHLHDASLESAINYLYRKDCWYYVIATRPDDKVLDIPKNIPDKLCLAKPVEDYHLAVISTSLHDYLEGFGLQNIIEKIDIHCRNNEREHCLYESIDKFNSATTT